MENITIKQYIKLKQIIKSANNDEKELLKMLATFLKLDMTKTKTENDTIIYQFLNNFNEGDTLVNRFTHKGIEYGFIPNLSTISTGEWIDLENYMQDDSTLHLALAVLYRPIKKEYKDLYTIDKYSKKYTDNIEVHAEKFFDLPYQIASGATSFFLVLGQILLDYFPQYTNLVEEK